MQNRTGWIVGIIIVVVLAVLAMMQQQGRLGSSKGYQAVFLSNGQVYFGKVSNERSNTVIVKDIYYLQVQKQLQPVKEGEETAQTNTQVQLIKLGNELHGPVDLMRINHDQILFIEDLKDDGRVVKAIKAFQERGSATTSPSATPSASAS